jgi:hypothetical protein
MFTAFRKFYEIDAPPEVAPSIASVMAKSGVLRQPGDDGAIPKINTEKKEEPTTAPATPAPATAAKPAEKATPEPPKPAEVAKTEPTQTAPPANAPNWQEVLKTQQPDTILKELGYGDKLVEFLKENKDLDPKILGFVNHWKSNEGNVKDYLRALDTDFSKMAPEDVMKYQLQVQNPEFDAKQLDRLFKSKVIDRYKLDPQLFSEEEVEDGRIELMADVKSIRTTLAEQQQNYLFPKPVPKEAGPDPKAQQQEALNEFKTQLNNDPVIKDIVANKRIMIGEGADAFSYAVDPSKLMDILLNDETWASKMLTMQEKPDGSKTWLPNGRKQALVSAILDDDEKFLREYATHYKALGGKAAIAPIENAKPPASETPSKSETEPASPAAAAAKRGRIVPGGN